LKELRLSKKGPAVTNRIPLFERLLIESQSNCNRSCWFCPRTYDRSGKYLDSMGNAVLKQMPTEKILDLFDQAQALGFQGSVGFHHFSEPLLDQRNILLAREAKRRGMKPDLHTNGDVLKRDSALCAEVERVYYQVVVGIYDYQTDAELDEIKSYWRKRLPRVDVRFSCIGVAGARSAYSIGVPKALAPSDSRMSIPDLTYSNAPCHRPLIRMIIQHDGEVCHCCEDIGGIFKLGNIHQNSMEELWFSEHHQQIINELVAGEREKYGLCRNCPMSPTGPALDGKKIDISRRRYQPDRR
jgi:radical SAM protein with 4Fe4S-binding SPASM domain